MIQSKSEEKLPGYDGKIKDKTSSLSVANKHIVYLTRQERSMNKMHKGPGS